MRSKSKFCGGLLAVAVAAGAVPIARAQESGGLPAERQAGSVSYVSGGIAEGESKRFLAAFGRYPLAVQLFERAGSGNAYTADAMVRITDSSGRAVLEEKSDGPFLLVRLPAGDYRIAATLKGHTLPEQRVRVTASGHARATFVFPAGAG